MDRERERESKRARDRGVSLQKHSRSFTHRGIHDAAGKQMVDNKNKGVMGREWTISNIKQHYDYNAATMEAPTNENFNFDFDFNNYFHLLYEVDNFITLGSHAVEGIKGWRCTEGGSDARALARVGAGGGTGYSFRSHPHYCFCEGEPCKHVDFTGVPSEHKVLPCTQEKADRQRAT